jgi:hypothetical protein
LEVGYVVNRLVKGVFKRDLNLVDRATGLRPVAGFTQFSYFDSAESTHYNALQVSFRRRVSQNLALNVAYSWSNNMSYGEGDIGNSVAAAYPQDPNNIAPNKGPTPWSTPHRLLVDFVYELPTARLLSGSARRLLLSGWQVGGIFSAQSGFPLIDILQPSAWPGSRPDYIGGSAVNENYRETRQYLNPAAFARVPVNALSAAPVRPGTLGRGAIREPGLINVDMALTKNVIFTERLRLQLRIDAFNALNHVNYGVVSGNITTGNFGRLTSTRGARQTQLSARFSF